MPTRLLSLACLAALIGTATAADPPPEERIRAALRDMKAGPDADRGRAAHALWDVIHYKGIGKVPAGEVVAGLVAATDDPSEYVRGFAAQALSSVEHDAAVPPLTALLGHRDGRVRHEACLGLTRHGPKAKAAAPHLLAGVNADRLGTVAFGALVAAGGADAVPPVLAAAERGRFGKDTAPSAARALAPLGDPRADAFMDRMLALDDYSAPESAATHFSKRGDAAALSRLRRCLSRMPVNSAEPPRSGKSFVAIRIRSVAVAELARRKDAEAFPVILKMVDTDPSVLIRRDAADALRVYADARAVPALARALAVKNDAFTEQEVNGEYLRDAAAAALAKIGTPDALAALYAGLFGPHAGDLGWFWTRDAKGPAALAAFIQGHDARPVAPDLAAAAIAHLLDPGDVLARRAEEPNAAEKVAEQRKLVDGPEPVKELTAQEKAAAAFRAAVDDPERFGPAADLTKKGKYRVRTRLTFYTGGFARAGFSFGDPGRDGHSEFGYAVLYRKVGGRWKPVGKCGEWIT